jgi:hypothetical protein
VQQPSGDIAFRTAGHPGVWDMMSMANLTNAQKDYLRSYVKEHPEQQWATPEGQNAQERKVYDDLVATGQIRKGQTIYAGSPSGESHSVNPYYAPAAKTEDPFEAGDEAIDDTSEKMRKQPVPIVTMTYGGIGKPIDVAAVNPWTPEEYDPNRDPWDLVATDWHGAPIPDAYYDPREKVVEWGLPNKNLMSFTRLGFFTENPTGLDLYEMVNTGKLQVRNTEDFVISETSTTPITSTRDKISVGWPQADEVKTVSKPKSMWDQPIVEGGRTHSEIAQQVGLSMMPLPGFISKPISTVASWIIGKGIGAPVIGGAVKGSINVLNARPSELIMKPWTDRELARVAADYNKQMGFSGTSHLSYTGTKIDTPSGFRETRIIEAKGPNGETLATFAPGSFTGTTSRQVIEARGANGIVKFTPKDDYVGPGLKVVFQQDVKATTRNVISGTTSHNAMMNRLTLQTAKIQNTANALPGLLPSVVGGLVTRQNISASTKNIMPNMNISTSRDIQSEININLEMPKLNTKTEQRSRQDTIGVQTSRQGIGTRPSEITLPKFVQPSLSLPVFRPPTSKNAITIKPFIPDTRTVDPFTMRPIKSRRVYTYRNDPDSLLGAFGGSSRKGKKRGRSVLDLI